MRSKNGARALLCCTEIGKVFLANERQENIEQMAALITCRRFMPCVKVGFHELIARLARFATEDCAIDNEDREVGLKCNLVPICNRQGIPIAALSVSRAGEKIDEVIGEGRD